MPCPAVSNEMVKSTISLQEAAAVIGRLKAAAEGNGRFPEVVMPNGRRLVDCTLGYIEQLVEAMQLMGLRMPESRQGVAQISRLTVPMGLNIIASAAVAPASRKG
jgi:hypothetical protein